MTLSDNTDTEFPFWVEEEDSIVKIYWDGTHPVTSVFNDWTDKQFLEMLTSYAKTIVSSSKK